MQRKIMSVLVILSILFAFAGCNNVPAESMSSEADIQAPSSSSQAPASESDAPAAAPVNIVYWSTFGPTGGGFDYLEKVKAAFEAQYPDITLEVVYQSGYDAVAEKLLAAIVANAMPNMVQIEEALLPQFEAIAIDLTTIVGQDIIDRYEPGLMRSSYANDVLKALPLARSMSMLHINKTMFEECDLPVEGPQTWDEVYEFSKVIKEKKGIPGFAAYWDSDAWYWESVVYSSGLNIVTPDGTAVDFDNEDGYRIVELWQQMVNEGLMYNTYLNQTDFDNAMTQEFYGQRVGMVFSSSGGLPSRVEKCTEAGFELAEVMTPKDKERSVVSGGSNLLVTTQGDDAVNQACGKVIELLSTDEMAADVYLITGYLPPTTGAQNVQALKDVIAEYPQYSVVLEQMQYAHARPWTKNWKEMYTVLVDELQAAMLNTTTPGREYVHTAAEKCQAIIDENK